jgi:CheY-like chemotaxis protein
MGLKVLIVDEEPAAMGYYIDALTECGFDVGVCENPSEAADMCRSLMPDLIILDIMMPPGDKYRGENHHDGLRTGFFVLRDLRSCCKDVPVIVLTNVTDRESLALFEGGPQLHIIGKPDCPPFELVTVVHGIIAAGKEAPGKP